MARTHYVTHARTRYARVPVLDENGQPKITEVNRTTKTGRQVTMAVTREDRTRPLPPETCESCQALIIPAGHPDHPGHEGDPYKWVQPRTGPYGGRRRVRCGECPGWRPWDLSDSLAAQAARIGHEFAEAIDSAADPDDVQSALDEAASGIRELAEGRRESAQAIEEGFGHPTSQSEELESHADELDQWADSTETANIPDLPGPEEGDCTECETGRPDAGCKTCAGTGTCTPENPTEDQMDEWRTDCAELLEECPVWS